VIEELERMQVFYVNIGGGEHRAQDFWELLDHAASHHVGVKFSTNGSHIDGAPPPGLAASDYGRRPGLDRRRHGRRQRCGPRPRLLRHALEPWSGSPRRASRSPKISVVVTRHNAGQLDEFKAIADRYGAQLRITRLRPSAAARRLGRAPPEPRPPSSALYICGCWSTARSPHRRLLLHLSAYGEACRG